MNIGKNIKNFRKNKKLTQKQLADIIGVSVVTIQNYENGRREPNMETLKKIASALDIKLNDLLLDELDSFTNSLKNNIEKLANNNPKHDNVLSSFETALSSLTEMKKTKSIDEFQLELDKFLKQVNATRDILENKLAVSNALGTFFYSNAIIKKFNFDFKKLSNDEFNEISQYMFLAIYIKLSEIIARNNNLKEGE
jgi:Predicted transcription factor, homolog of eukaryotic MBF1